MNESAVAALPDKIGQRWVVAAARVLLQQMCSIGRADRTIRLREMPFRDQRSAHNEQLRREEALNDFLWTAADGDGKVDVGRYIRRGKSHHLRIGDECSRIAVVADEEDKDFNVRQCRFHRFHLVRASQEVERLVFLRVVEVLPALDDSRQVFVAMKSDRGEAGKVVMGVDGFRNSRPWRRHQRGVFPVRPAVVAGLSHNHFDSIFHRYTSLTALLDDTADESVTLRPEILFARSDIAGRTNSAKECVDLFVRFGVRRAVLSTVELARLELNVAFVIREAIEFAKKVNDLDPRAHVEF